MDHAENDEHVSLLEDRPEKLRADASVLVDRHLLRDADASGRDAVKELLPAHTDAAAAGGTRPLRRSARLDSMVAFCERVEWNEHEGGGLFRREKGGSTLITV